MTSVSFATDDVDDDASVATVETEDGDDFDDSNKSWRVHRKYNSDDTKIVKVHGRTIEFRVGAGTSIVVRDVKFESTQAAHEFEAAWEKVVVSKAAQTASKVEKYHNKIDLNPEQSLNDISRGSKTDAAKENVPASTFTDGRIRVLVEIVSATNIPIGDISTTDGYIIVRHKVRL